MYMKNPEQYLISGNSSIITLRSEMLRDYTKTLLIGNKEIHVSIYDQRACPKFNSYKEEDGYLYTAKLTRKNWKMDINIPSGSYIYMKIEDSVKDFIGSGKTCFWYQKFVPEKNNNYLLDVGIQGVGFGCDTPSSFYRLDEDERRPERTFKTARLENAILSWKVEPDFCQ